MKSINNFLQDISDGFQDLINSLGFLDSNRYGQTSYTTRISYTFLDDDDYDDDDDDDDDDGVKLVSC